MKCQQAAFRLHPGVHYLNNAYKAPLLRSAEEAALEALVKARNPQEINPSAFFSTTAEVQALFGRLVNCKPQDVAIIPSVSYGVGSVLANLPCQPGQYALTIKDEFPSDYFALERWCTVHKAPMQVIGPPPEARHQGPGWHERLLEAIRPEAAVLLLSSVHWMNGLKFDLEAIGRRCAATGTKLIVDGTQSVGALPIDVQKCRIDALICADYKWLLGPYSLGLAYIGPAFQQGQPLEESWMNRRNAQDFSSLADYDPNYTDGAGRFNVGETTNFILMPMLKAALEQVLEWTPEAIQRYAGQQIQPLLEYLQEQRIPLEPEAYFSPHLFGLRLPDQIDPESVRKALLEREIILSRRGRHLRVSVHLYNTADDIRQLIRVLQETR